MFFDAAVFTEVCDRHMNRIDPEHVSIVLYATYSKGNRAVDRGTKALRTMRRPITGMDFGPCASTFRLT